MKESKPVRDFRKVFSKALESGETATRRNDAQLGVNIAITALQTQIEVLRCLDIYCGLVDPQHPATDKNAFEIGRGTGYALFKRALFLAPQYPQLATMIASFGDIIAANTPLTRKDQAVAYARRWAMLEPNERNEILTLAKTAVAQANAGKPRMLLDTLRDAARTPAAKSASTESELLAFEPSARDGAKAEFLAKVRACAVSWSPSRDKIKVDAAIDAVDAAFDAFEALLKRELKSQIDFFRLLKWLRQPYETADHRIVQGVSIDLMAPLDGIGQSLYTEIVLRGQLLAETTWNHLPTQVARGLTGEDLTFIMHPLDAHGMALLTRRLKVADSDAASLHQMLKAWRQARLVGRYHSVDILDEVDVLELGIRAKKAWSENPKAVANRFIHHPDRIVRRDQKFWMNEKYEYGFNVVWIDLGTVRDSDKAFITIKGIADFVFSAGHGELADLQEDEFFRLLAENAHNLTVFLLTYLRIIGFAFEITVTAISGGIGEVVFEFAKNRLVELATDTGMDIAGIENPWLRAGIGLATGFASGHLTVSKVTSAPVRSLEQIAAQELEETVMAALAWEKQLAKTRGLLERGTNTPIAEIGDRNIMTLDFSEPHASPPLDAAEVPVPKGVGVIERMKAAASDHGLGMTPRQGAEDLGLATASAGAGPGANVSRIEANISERSADLATQARATGGKGIGGGGAGAGGAKPRPELGEAFRKSEPFKLLERYDQFQPAGVKDLVRGARNTLAREVAAGTKSLEVAEKELTVLLNQTRERTGELVAAMVVMSNFKGAKLIASIPTRGEGAPVLDLVFSIKDKGRKMFILVEAKGGEVTALGSTRNYKYAIEEGTGNLLRRPAMGEDSIRQASGPWYYQRFAEIYALGGKQNRELAIELMDAAREGRIVSVVNKSGVNVDPNFVETSNKIIDYFQKTKWTATKDGFAIPANGIP